MLMDAFLTDTARPLDSSLTIYCRQEGLDYRYLLAEISKRKDKKKPADSGKKFTVRKISV